MKKIIALLLALALTLSCAAVLAEGSADKEAVAEKVAAAEKQELGTVDLNGAFVLKGTIPEGYTYKVNELNPGVFINADIEKEGDVNAPYLNIMIYLEDSYEPGTRLNDVPEDIRREIEDSFTADNEVKFEYTETSNGTTVLKVTEIGDDPDWIAYYTIYEGYEVELTIRFKEEAQNPVLDEDITQKAVQFLNDLDFVKPE